MPHGAMIKDATFLLLGVGGWFCPRILCSRGLIADANRCLRCQPWDRLVNVSHFHFISKNCFGKVPFDNAVASRTILILHTVLFFTRQIKSFPFVSFVIYSWHRKAGRGSRWSSSENIKWNIFMGAAWVPSTADPKK